MMTRKHKKPTIVPLLLMVAFLVVGTAGFSYAAFFLLEIINIKPAGTGSPPIPATNRIFRAYPGIEYNIRAAVIGGLYPFTYSLKNAPPGMTINPATGEISWPNPQSSAGPITLTVTDSENTTVSTTWSIDVTTNGFLFVDVNSQSTIENGSIESPYKSIRSLVLYTDQTNLNDIVYFRNGNYSFFEYQGDIQSVPEMNLRKTPTTWIGFPGETVAINGNDVRARTTNAIFLDNLTFKNFGDNAFVVQGGVDYQTIRRCVFSNLTAVRTENENQGFLYFNSGGPGNYLVIQDNEFSYFTGASAIGSMYDTYHALIEDNYIHDPGGTGVTGINNGIGAKSRTDYLTVRKNKIIMPIGTIFGHAMNSIMFNADYIDISFNLFSAAENKMAHTFSPRTDGPTKNIYYYRNTLIGYIRFQNIDGNNCDPGNKYIVKNNVIINDNNFNDWATKTIDFISYYTPTAKNNPQNCIDDIDNIKGTMSDNIINNNGEFSPIR